jgi:hypothetical protein
MSTVPTPPTVTVTSHQKHWYDFVMLALQAAQAANPVLMTFIPAPVEAGIQIAITLGPVVVGTIQAATTPTPAA